MNEESNSPPKFESGNSREQNSSVSHDFEEKSPSGYFRQQIESIISNLTANNFEELTQAFLNEIELLQHDVTLDDVEHIRKKMGILQMETTRLKLLHPNDTRIQEFLRRIEEKTLSFVAAISLMAQLSDSKFSERKGGHLDYIFSEEFDSEKLDIKNVLHSYLEIDGMAGSDIEVIKKTYEMFPHKFVSSFIDSVNDICIDRTLPFKCHLRCATVIDVISTSEVQISDTSLKNEFRAALVRLARLNVISNTFAEDYLDVRYVSPREYPEVDCNVPFKLDKDTLAIAEGEFMYRVPSGLIDEARFLMTKPYNIERLESFRQSVVTGSDLVKSGDPAFGSKEEFELYSFFQKPELRQSILKIPYNISVEELSMSEQKAFVTYLANASYDMRKALANLKERHGPNGLRIFVSLADQFKLQDSAVHFALISDFSDDVIDMYCALLDEETEVESYIKSEFSETEDDLVGVVSLAQAKIFAEAKTFLVTHIRDDIKINPNEFCSHISKARGMAAAISAAFELKKIKGVESLRSFRQEILTGDEVIFGGLHDELIRIYEENYRSRRYQYSESGMVSLIDNFNTKLLSDTVKVYVWRLGEREVLTYLYVDEDVDKKIVYIGGSNANDNFANSKAGIGLLQQMVGDYDAKGWTITAEAAPDNARAYILLYDFIAYRRNDDSDENYVLDVARYSGQKWKSSAIKQSEIIDSLASELEYSSADGSIRYVKVGESAEAIDQYLESGYVVTKTFTKKSPNKESASYFILEYAPFVREALLPKDSQTAIAA